MLEFLILLPLLTGLAVFALPVRMGRVVLAATGLLHLQPDWARVIWPLVALSVLAGTLVERRLAR